MADPPPAATSASPQNLQPDQLPASTPQNPNPNPLHSPQIPPPPTISDLSAIPSPQIDLAAVAAAAAAAGAIEFPPRTPVIQAPSPSQAAAAGGGAFGQMQHSGSASRLAAAGGQLPQYAAAAAARMYGGQMSFSGGVGQIGQQQQQLAAHAALLRQGHLRLLQGQGNAASAAHFGLQSQMMAQLQQKGMMQGAQFSTAGAVQVLQGMQSMGVMGATLGMNQMRPNGTIEYGAQQHFTHAQMQPQQASQQQALLAQKVASQGLSRTTSPAPLSSQLSGSSQNGQLVPMSLPQQQQWLKMQSSSSPLSPHQLHLQQRLMMQQRQQKFAGMNQHQITQTQHQHPRLSSQQLTQQQHVLQQFLQQQQQQQQQSPKLSASASQKSVNLTGSQPGTPLSSATMAGGSASQGAKASNQPLGKRKIQHLVAQVDPLARLDPEVEDLLLEVTAFACKLAKHRKSSILEPKDVLLHLERNWHLSVPGFSEEDKDHQRNSVKTLMDAQQLECEVAGIKGTSKLVANNSVGNHQMSASPNIESSSLPIGGLVSKMPWF